VRTPTWRRVALLLALCSVTVFAIVAFTASAVLLAAFVTTPKLAAFREERRPSRALMLAANGTSVESLRLDFNYSREAWVPLAAFPPATLSLLWAREDKRARLHPGVDPLAMAAAAKDALTKGTHRGASTLAMQVARLAFPRIKTLSLFVRKPIEMGMAIALRARWGASGIEEAWLNLVPMPGEAEGLPAAARLWLGLEISALSDGDIDTLLSFAPRPGGAKARAWLPRRSARLGPKGDRARNHR